MSDARKGPTWHFGKRRERAQAEMREGAKLRQSPAKINRRRPLLPPPALHSLFWQKVPWGEGIGTFLLDIWHWNRKKRWGGMGGRTIIIGLIPSCQLDICGGKQNSRKAIKFYTETNWENMLPLGRSGGCCWKWGEGRGRNLIWSAELAEFDQRQKAENTTKIDVMKWWI